MAAEKQSVPAWLPNTAGFRRRDYNNYGEYRRHQAEKLEHLNGTPWITSYEETFAPVLRDRLLDDSEVTRGKSVLCLGARLGGEVRTFVSLGCFAIGIDLNPGPNNEYVVHGDFHSLNFADDSIDITFTNTLDHVFDLDRVIREILRVTKVSGHVIVEAMNGSREGKSDVDPYDCFHWERIDNIIDRFTEVGFRIQRRQSFDVPWNGEHLLMRKEAG